MIKPFALMGKFALFIAGMAILAAMSLLMFGVYLASWPIMRVPPRNRKMTSLMGLAVALTAVARAYELDKFTGPSATDATDDTDESRGDPVELSEQWLDGWKAGAVSLATSMSLATDPRTGEFIGPITAPDGTQLHAEKGGD